MQLISSRRFNLQGSGRHRQPGPELLLTDTPPTKRPPFVYSLQGHLPRSAHISPPRTKSTKQIRKTLHLNSKKKKTASNPNSKMHKQMQCIPSRTAPHHIRTRPNRPASTFLSRHRRPPTRLRGASGPDPDRRVIQNHQTIQSARFIKTVPCEP